MLCALASPAPAAKTDVVVMDNGNVIVGEAKKMVRGLLEYKVDDVKGRLMIEWEHVVRLTCNRPLDIELANGVFYFGTLIESEADGVLRIQTESRVFDVALADVAFLEPIHASFLKRTTGEISAGLSYTKSTDILQGNLDGALRYRRRVSLTLFRPNAIVTSRTDEPSKTNLTLPLSHFRFFRNRWFYRMDLVGSRNDELGLDLRASVSGGIGRRVVGTNRSLLLLSMLLSGNREYASDGTVTENTELAFDTMFEAFRYDSPKLELNGNLTLFASLTTSDRYRADFDGRFSLELLKDFYWDIGQIYYRYDSAPSDPEAETTDYGLLTGLRYKFQ